MSGHSPFVPAGNLRLRQTGGSVCPGTARIEFSEHHSVDAAEGDEIEVSVRYRFIEEDRVGGYAEVAIEAPRGFTSVPGRTDTYKGRLKPGVAAEFRYLSEDYDPSWSGTLSVSAELTPTGDGAGSQGSDIR